MTFENTSIDRIQDVEQQRALIRQMTPPAIVRVFTRSTPSGRASLVGLVPIESLAPVLLQDQMVFRPLDRQSIHAEKLEGYIEPITYKEMKALTKAGYEAWIIETEWNEMGQAIAWGYRYSTHTFDTEEALERLEAILASPNDTSWKLAALEALPKEYLALAIKADPENIDKLLARIAAINPDLSKLVDHMVDAEDKELFMRAIETREDAIKTLGEVASEQDTINLTSEASAVVASLQERRQGRDLLAKLRGE